MSPPPDMKIEEDYLNVSSKERVNVDSPIINLDFSKTNEDVKKINLGQSFDMSSETR